MRRGLLRAVVSVLVLVLAQAQGAVAAPPPGKSSPNLQLVAQVAGTGGTDIEFFSREMASYRNELGEVVTPPAPELRHFAVAGNQTGKPSIIDITNPEAPYVAAQIPCVMSQGDVQISEERNLVVLANGTSSAASGCKYTDAATGAQRPMPPGSAMVDISDLYAPVVVGAAPGQAVSHNQTLTPDGQYLFISGSGIAETSAKVPVYDLADITQPKLLTTFTAPGNSPHDIRFNADGTRAYMAGVSTFRIVDTTDKANPRLISTFYPPGATIGHDVLVSPDGAFLFAGDEAGGGATYPCPGGAVHVFDIRNESQPKYLGQSFAGAGPVTNRDAEITTEVGSPGSCTSHVMDMNPDGKSFTIGWYAAGTRVFSFAGLYGADGKPKATAVAAAYGHDGVGLVETGWSRPDGGSTWAAKQYAAVPGYIFSNDRSAGMYVTKILPEKS